MTCTLHYYTIQKLIFIPASFYSDGLRPFMVSSKFRNRCRFSRKIPAIPHPHMPCLHSAYVHTCLPVTVCIEFKIPFILPLHNAFMGNNDFMHFLSHYVDVKWIYEYYPLQALLCYQNLRYLWVLATPYKNKTKRITTIARKYIIIIMAVNLILRCLI